MRKAPRYIERTLMCRDHEVCAFTYDLGTRGIAGRVIWADRRFAPIGALGHDGRPTAPLLSSWISARAIPQGRSNASALLRALGIDSTEELMLTGLGLSLSDQYWMRPHGFSGSWDDVSLYRRPFSEEVGRALVAPDAPTREAAIEAVAGSEVVLSTSPDPALNGNLPKFWRNSAEGPRLFKSGRADRLVLEPFCEVAATSVCSALLDAGDFVPYRLEHEEAPGALSSCPAFTDDSTEFVPAADAFRLAPRENHLSYHERYALLLESRGIGDARKALSKMLAVDRLIGNVDRHWGNFGILVDTETREWISPAPLFDMGESFGCDRALVGDPTPRKALYRMPFRTDIASQFEAFAEDMGWFDPEAAAASIETAVGILSRNPLAAALPGYPQRVENSMAAALEALERRAAELSPVAVSLRQAVARENR